MIVNWRITVLATGFVLKPCYYQSYAYSISDLTSVRSRRQCQKRQRRQRLEGFKTTFETTKINNNRHSASDWLYNMGTLPRSSVLREIRNPVFSVMAWSTFIALFHQFLIQSSSTRLQNMALAMRIGTQLHSLLVSSLGLLLVFRTNSAYQRFTEGRRIWEQILSHSRNFSRLLTVYEMEVGAERNGRVKRLLAAFPYLLRHHIQHDASMERSSAKEIPDAFQLTLTEPTTTMESIIDKNIRMSLNPSLHGCSSSSATRCSIVDIRTYPWCLLPKSSLHACAAARNKPLFICDRISREIVQIPYSSKFTSRERLTMLRQIDKLSNAIGECERIHQTAVPLNYARHSLRTLTLWLFTLPFALVRDFGLLTGPVCGITAWLMFGVYQIGVNIEDPFQKSLQLSNLCNAIRLDILHDDSTLDQYISSGNLNLEGDLFVQLPSSSFGHSLFAGVIGNHIPVDCIP